MKVIWQSGTSKMKLKNFLHTAKKQSNDTNQMFSAIENSRTDKELVIIATGPTVNDYTDAEISNFLKDKDVFTIKQAYHKFKNETDMHFFNCCNLPIEEDFYGYKYSENRPFVVSSSPMYKGGGRWSLEQRYDIFFTIPTVNQNHLSKNTVNFLCKSKNIEDYLFSNNLNRPCGPGIFFETVLFFAIHLGYKKIYTIGWDYSYNQENFGHFYANNKKASNVRIPALIPQKEIDYVLDFTEYMANWLEHRGIDLTVIGDKSCVSKKFNRITKV